MAILPVIAQNMNIDTTHIPSYSLFLSVHIFQPHPDVSKYQVYTSTLIFAIIGAAADS